MGTSFQDTVPLLQHSLLDEKIIQSDSVVHLNEHTPSSDAAKPISTATTLKEIASLALSRIVAAVATVANAIFKALVAGAKFVYNPAQETPTADQTQHIEEAVAPYIQRAEALGMDAGKVKKLEETLTHSYKACAAQNIPPKDARSTQLLNAAREALMELLKSEIEQLKTKDPPDDKQIKAKTVEYRLLSQTFPTPTISLISVASNLINSGVSQAVKQQIEAHVDHLLEEAYNRNPQLFLPKDTRNDLIQGFQQAYTKKSKDSAAAFDPQKIRVYDLPNKARLAFVKLISLNEANKAEIQVISDDLQNPYNSTKLHMELDVFQFEREAHVHTTRLCDLIMSGSNLKTSEERTAYKEKCTLYAKENKQNLDLQLKQLESEISTFVTHSNDPKNALLLIFKAQALEFDYDKHNSYYALNDLKEFSDQYPQIDKIHLFQIVSQLVSGIDFTMAKKSEEEIQALYSLAVEYDKIQTLVKKEHPEALANQSKAAQNKEQLISSFIKEVDNKSTAFREKWFSARVEDDVNRLQELKDSPPVLMTDIELQELIRQMTENIKNLYKFARKEISDSALLEKIERSVSKIGIN